MTERFAGKYQKLRHLANGGMGEVFLASLQRTAGFSKLVVVKRILPHFAQDPDFVRMFVQEARLSAGLDHPNIVRVYDFGRAGDSFFLVMEYLHGDTLLALLPRAVASPEGLSLEVTLTVILGVCAGLHFAHEMAGPDGRPLGIVHRDISPANVFVTQSGEVKILDFGIAKAISAGAVTREGTRKGKLAYMSPEQCLGEPLDRRSDVFAIGILLYEMTTAKRLFRGSDFEIMTMITKGQVPPPSSRALDYPPALEAVVLKALAVDPAHRHASAQELHDDLERVAVELGLRPSAAALGRFVRKLTNDKRYPSLDEENPADDAPTLNFFASLNEVVTVGDIPIEPDVPRRAADDAPVASRSASSFATSGVIEPRGSRTGPLLVVGGLLVALGGAAAYLVWPRASPEPEPTPAPAPAVPVAAPVDAPVTTPDPEPAATPTPPAPPPAATPTKTKPTIRKKRATKRREP